MKVTRLYLIWVVIIGALLLTVACLPSRVPFSAIPIAPRAEVAQLDGPEEVLIDLTQSDIRRTVKDAYGKARIEIYALPAEMDWSKISQFYADQLKGRDWQSEPRFSKRTGYYQMIGWSRGGRFNRQALVVAYLEKPEGVGRNYLLVALAPKEDN
ncbi:MAG TPA: hypothetical protein VF658_06695 [Pyrinomonadaceae bacterium]|jgi:hypothetical protein